MAYGHLCLSLAGPTEKMETNEITETVFFSSGAWVPGIRWTMWRRFYIGNGESGFCPGGGINPPLRAVALQRSACLQTLGFAKLDRTGSISIEQTRCFYHI
jgi:hypothetical protein